MARQRKLPDGMVLRGKTYYARFMRGGRLVRKRLASDFVVARGLLSDLKAKADRGDFGIVGNDCSWSDIKTAFLQWAKQETRNPRDYVRDLTRFEEFYQPQNVRDVTPSRVHAFREWRIDRGVSPRTVNREVGTVGNMLNKAVAWGYISENPIASVTPLPHDTLAKERRSLTPEEIQALFEASSDGLKPVWRMFACTGMRKSELVGLRFSDVDFARQTITIRAAVAKSKKAREIPLDDDTYAMLVELKERAADREPVPGLTPAQTRQQLASFSRDHVFVTAANTPWRNNLLTRFYSICKGARIDGAHRGGDVDIHSLRVSFCTLAIEHGGNPKAVQAILGHATLAMTMNVYGRATESGKRAAVDALPFASSSAPAHVLSLADSKALQSGAGLAQVSEMATKPLKNKAKMA